MVFQLELKASYTGVFYQVSLFLEFTPFTLKIKMYLCAKICYLFYVGYET